MSRCPQARLVEEDDERHAGGDRAGEVDEGRRPRRDRPARDPEGDGRVCARVQERGAQGDGPGQL